LHESATRKIDRSLQHFVPLTGTSCRPIGVLFRLVRANPHVHLCWLFRSPGVALDHLRPYLKEEVANVWRLWKVGIVRENHARAMSEHFRIVSCSFAERTL
jgi:hypothetical protein